MPSHIGQNHRTVAQADEEEDAQNRVHPEQYPANGQHNRAELAVLYRVVYGDLIAIKSWHNEQSSFRELESYPV